MLHNVAAAFSLTIRVIAPPDGKCSILFLLQVGGAELLYRLQKTYQLNVTMLAAGIVPLLPAQYRLHTPTAAVLTSTTSFTLDFEDCYHCAAIAFENGDYSNARLWLLEALRQLDQVKRDEVKSIQMAVVEQIHQRFVECSEKLGLHSDAIAHLDSMLMLEPENKWAQARLSSYRLTNRTAIEFKNEADLSTGKSINIFC